MLHARRCGWMDAQAPGAETTGEGPKGGPRAWMGGFDVGKNSKNHSNKSNTSKRRQGMFFFGLNI